MEMHTIESLRATHGLCIDAPSKRVLGANVIGLLSRAWRGYHHSRRLARDLWARGTGASRQERVPMLRIRHARLKTTGFAGMRR